eukprot:TRINITY_DN749_c0_g4_i1.p1 TRINITY_DN749_c0_g4~~TRINITY_DN749_c0_g4_i1.p1  ORF type:complete len:752 (+),score=95.91 TRINITY_DN749_c0_g4_i1:99-2258(+)
MGLLKSKILKMKGFILSLFILSLVALSLGKSWKHIKRSDLNMVLPPLMAKLALQIKLKATMLRDTSLGFRSPREEQADCLDAVSNMVTENYNGTLFSFLLYSFKGLNDIGDFKSCSVANGTRYLLLTAKVSDGTPASGYFGLCLPQECSANYLTENLRPMLITLLKELMNIMGIPITGFFSVTDDAVNFVDVIAKNKELGTISPLGVILIIIGILAVIAALIFTYMDYRLSKGKFSGETGNKVVECWSLVRNAKFLFYNKNPVDMSLEVLNGVRVLSMCWVISGHTFDYFNVSPIANIFDLPDKIEHSYNFQLIMAGTFSIDVFFFMSGFLNALTMHASLSKIKGANESLKATLVAIAHRYIRLLPLYLIAILTTIAIVPYFFSEGPLGSINEWQMNICKEKWWHNLLYIQNFTKIGEGCLIWSWYLANDMQFFLVTPLLLIAYHKNKRLTFIIIAIVVSLSVISQIYVIWHYELSISYFYEAEGELFEDYYVKPYCRINAYLLGIIIAWMYFAWKEDKEGTSMFCFNRMTRKWVENPYIKYSLIAIGIGITYACVSLQYVFNHYWKDIRTWHNVLYIIVSRPLFVVGLLMVIYPALLGKEKILFTILGAPFWNPLAKLTYGAYLFHVIILIAEKSGEYHSSFFTVMRVLFFAIHIWVLSYLISLILTLFFELPIAQLEKTFLFPRRRQAVNAISDKKGKAGQEEKLLGAEESKTKKEQ